MSKEVKVENRPLDTQQVQEQIEQVSDEIHDALVRASVLVDQKFALEAQLKGFRLPLIPYDYAWRSES